ncbi:nitrate reductase [soil metagenome]
MTKTVRTTCPSCGVGCGVSATLTAARTVTIKGDGAHPANMGRLCSKGTHLGETVGLEGRLLYPEIGGERVDWDTAIGHVAEQFAATIAQHGPDSVAFYVSGQLLTEDYYVANKLMKGFIGTANIDTNSRLCMASAVAAHNRAFGEDVVPCSYSDLDEADLIVLVGSNTAWCHPIIWQRIEAARTARGTKLVVIDPRRTETAERADLHLPISPDGDVALFNRLLAAMRDRGLTDEAFLADRVSVPEDFWEQLSHSVAALPTPFGSSEVENPVARGRSVSTSPDTNGGNVAGIDADLFAQFVDLFAAHPKAVTLFSQGANQSTSGTDKGNAIINIHLATGRIGKPGAGPFSITGQPNAMGGREVGGLASTLAVHMGFSEGERDRAQRFWKAPAICPAPGLKAVEMFDAVADGRIKAIWIMATNPAVSMPDAGFVRDALAACPLGIVSDCIADTDTARLAHVKLPATGWGEKDGTVTNSERVISRQRRFMTPPGESRGDWEIVAAVGRAMGWVEAFSYMGAADVFREYAAQTAFENDGERVLNLGALAQISDADYTALAPVQWGGISPFASGRFPTPDGRARLVSIAVPAPRVDADFPLRLHTGRYRDQWHTMTRTGLSPRLSAHRPEPLVEVHPEDARAHGVSDGGLATVESPAGRSLYRVVITDTQARGSLFVPMHWTDAMSGGGRTGLLPGKDRDPISGQPGFKNSGARISGYAPEWRGFLVTVDAIAAPEAAYWTRSRVAGGWLTELAGEGDADIEALLPAGGRMEVMDMRRGMRRIVVLDDTGHLVAALFLTRTGVLPSRSWIAAQLGQSEAQAAELLAGRAATPAEDVGQIVCVCFDVGMKTILTAIGSAGLLSVEAVGAAVRAGTNCGSCRPAIAKMLEPERKVANG